MFKTRKSPLSINLFACCIVGVATAIAICASKEEAELRLYDE